ncbi:MAG: hypothetical protein N2Z21_05500, partial [Candidatus Sumerlaeaceae bacterium]|nr:hypothetical protein [Candidatus Sumerlaeaceae bacterium]
MIHKMVAAVNFQNVFSKRFAASVPVRLVGWLCVVLLSGALLSGSDSILRWALFLFAGLSPALALKTSYTVTELAAASVALSLGLLAAVAGTTALIGCYSTIVPYMLVISVAAACAVLVSRRTRVVLAKRELYAALVAISVSAALALTYGSNGPVATPTGLSYIVRHWLRRDGAYFFALVQQAIERGAIPHENPFIAGIPAYYATLGHCGLALLAPGKSVPAAVSLWGVLPLLHVAAVLLFYHFTVRLLVQYRAQRPERWALAAIALFCAWRPDFYTYPQSQSAFMPLLAWFCWWTLRPAFLRRSFDQGLALLWLILMAWIHTVSSVVALCFACGATVSRWRSTREQKPKRRRLFPVFMWLSGIAVAAWLTTHVGDAPYRDPVTKLSFLGVHLLNNHLFPNSILYIAGALALFAAWQHRRYGEFSTLALLLACGMGYTARGVCNVEAFS